MLKASRILSGELELDRLLERSMAVVIENAGAQRGALRLLDDEGELRGEVVADVEKTETLGAGFAQTIVDYCRRTREHVVLSNAVIREQFGSDPHIVATRPRSVLAMPLLNQGLEVKRT